MTDQSPAGLLVPEWVEVDDSGARLRMLASHCTECDAYMFPRRDACARCSAPDPEGTTIGPEAELYAFTQVHLGEREFMAGQARFAEGPIVVGYLQGDLPPTVGATVEVVPMELPPGENGEPATTYAFQVKESENA